MNKVINKLSKYGIDIKMVKFGIVGVINTLFGSGLMFILYNIFGCSYYFSTFCNYFFGSILSYFLNKYVTFKYKKRSLKVVIKFIVNIVLCYLVAYILIKPLIALLLERQSIKFIENVSMIVGMFVYVFLNYFGQRFLVFADEKR